MKTCPNCGAQLPDNAEYCGYCGAYVSQPVQPPPAAAPVGPPSAAPGQPYQAPGDVYGQQTPGYPPGYGYPQAYAPVHYAGFWIRAFALIIDNIVVLTATAPLWIWLAFTSWTNANGELQVQWTATRILLVVLAALIAIIYNTLMIGRYGATLGKMAVKIKVVRTGLGPVGYGTALLRETIGKWISGFICDLGYIWAGFDSRKQAWHDHLCSTLVIYR